ncbi:hypothetical protein HDV06_002153 [Boothiomyces sp. JEL0866]|nr:hypothetical protein HDV06_002153 [Boothiomyces sp. JEL0866]
MYEQNDPVKVACLSIAFLQSSSYRPLTQLSSPFIKERIALSKLSSTLDYFCWTNVPNLQLEIDAIDPSVASSATYKVLDQDTIHAQVVFSNLSVILYLNDTIWTFHDIRNQVEPWHASIQDAKKAFALKDEMQVEVDDYWKMYDLVIDPPQEIKRKAEEEVEKEEYNTEDDYWNAY